MRDFTSQGDKPGLEPLGVLFLPLGDLQQLITKMLVAHLFRVQSILARVFHLVSVRSAEQIDDILLRIAAQPAQ